MSDKEFLTYIRLKKIAYDDGTAMTSEELIDLSLAKFTILTDEGQWNKLSPEEEQVVVFSAKFDELKDANLKLSKQLAKKKEDKSKNKGNKKDGNKKKQEKKKGKKEVCMEASQAQHRSTTNEDSGRKGLPLVPVSWKVDTS